MTVNVEKSVCRECKWIETCQRLARVNIKESRNDSFSVIIEKCGIKNMDRSFKI